MFFKSFVEIETETKNKNRSIAFLPIGCTEQHGPFLPIETDSIISSAIANEVSNNLKGIFCSYVFPTINYSPTRSNKNFVGTVSISENSFRNYLEDVLLALKDSVFETIVIINGHGPAFPSIQEIVFKLNHSQFYNQNSIKPFYVIDVFDISKSIENRFGLKPGKHADWFEFLLTYKILGTEYYTKDKIEKLREYSRNHKYTAENSQLIGLPMELRSLDGIIGNPLPKEIDNIDKWSDEIWAEIISNIEIKITDSINNLKLTW